MKRSILAAVVPLLGACALTSPAIHTGIVPPARWTYAQGTGAAGDVVIAGWWGSFRSDELDRLVGQAQEGSYDVAAEIARVREAQARARMAGAALFPTVNGFADASRQGGLLVSDTELEGTSFDLGLAASYELDFWGRNRAHRDAAVANLHASQFDRDTVQLTVTAAVATGWLQTVALRERGRIAQQNQVTAQRMLSLVASRVRAGAASPLELAQQKGLVAAQQRSVAELAQQANDSATVLAVLIGVPVATMGLSAVSLEGVKIPAIDAGVPSALLTRRPDLAFEEAQLEAASADIAAARAAMLPNLTLSATVGTGSDRIRTLFDQSLYSVAAGLTAPIFDAGALAAGRDLAVARKEELLAGYRQAIVSAFGDVERALNAISGIDAQRAAQDEELAQAQRAFELADSRYRAGSETLLVVLDAQRSLYAARDEAVQLRAARLEAAVALYRALGGGWRAPGQASDADRLSHDSQMQAAEAQPHASENW